MLLIRLLHFLFGYVRFAASGGFPERFVNLCTGMRIPVWDMRPTGEGLTGKTKTNAYLALHRAARRAGMRLRIERKCGLPFALHRHRARFGLLIGALVCAALPIVLSQFLWVIDVASGDAWTRACVRQALAEIGIREGIRVSAVEASQAERALLLRLPQTEWIALNMHGSVLHVELRDTQTLPEQDDYTRPCHIVASKDGFLTRLEAYEGTEAAPLRTAVQQGQLLVSGALEHADGSVTFCHAKGYAEAQTTQRIRVRVDPDETYRTVDSARKRIWPECFALRVPLPCPRTPKNALPFTYIQTAVVRGLPLPIRCTVHRDLLLGAPRKLSAGQQKLLLASDFGQQAAAALRGCSVLQADLQRSAQSCVGYYRLLENIGTEQAILTEITD